MKVNQSIPFNKPYVAPKSFEYIKEALDSSHHQGGGPFNKKAAKMVSRINGGGEVFLTGSCTQALEMATLLLDFRPGDEVIMPSYTFTSAATALVNYGVVPVFVDIEPDTLNIDIHEVKKAISNKTKAISIVNYGGLGCDFEQLNRLAQTYNLFKIEDNAHGFGNREANSNVGTWGDVSTISFHATKNIQCGEGGAIVVNNETLLEKAHLLQEKGTNRREFLAGNVEKYQWMDKGGSFLMPEILCATLLAQLEEFSEIQSKRKSLWKLYFEKLRRNQNFAILHKEFPESHNSHMFAIRLDESNRNDMIAYLGDNLISASFHYQPLHSSQAGSKYSKVSQSLPNTDLAANSLLRLPLYYDLSFEDVEHISDVLVNFNFS